MIKKLCIFGLLFTLAALAAGRALVIPHVLEKSGVILGVGYNPSGALTRIDQFGQASGRSPLSLDVSPEGSAPVLFQAVDDLTSASKGATAPWSIHECDTSGPGQPGGGILAGPSSIVGLTIPALDAGSKEGGYIKIEMGAAGFNPKEYSVESKEEKKIIVKQKAWLTSNFRCRIDGVTDSVGSVSSIHVQAVDVDGDGVAEPLAVTTDPIVTVPLSKTVKVKDWMGTMEFRTLTVTVTDSLGNTLFSVIGGVRPIGFGLDNPFDFFRLDSNTPIAVQMRYVGTVTIVK